MSLKNIFKDSFKRTKKGWIFDVAVLAMVMVVATVIMVLLAYTWVQFKPQLDNLNTNESAFPLNASTQAQIDGIGNGYFLQNGPSFLILLYGVMVVALFITAFLENAGIISLPVGIIFLIGALFMAMLLSDFAHNILTSPTLGTITAQYYSGPLYILDNLPILTGILGIGYLIFIVLHKSGPNSGQFAGRIING